MPHLSFRIAAIRETFEESGILLAQPEDVLPSISLKDLFSWREKVFFYFILKKKVFEQFFFFFFFF